MGRKGEERKGWVKSRRKLEIKGRDKEGKSDGKKEKREIVGREKREKKKEGRRIGDWLKEGRGREGKEEI